LSIVLQGGTALIAQEFLKEAIKSTRKYPDRLFDLLDDEWKLFARQLNDDGLELTVPPVLGIVLTRCARRSAIPAVINDLRSEWREARRKVWMLLDSLRNSNTLAEALELQTELQEASRLFSPNRTALDSQPVRVLWEIIAAGAAGAGVAVLSGGKPVLGAAAGALTQAARNLPAFTHQFGALLFGRGAFDLAGRVRREASAVDLRAISRLLTESERKSLGIA
jgi:hypothetical protein